MAAAGKAGLLDLEKELTCSICTDILYQPLTLLDCLHTYCGSCLKEWFSWQAPRGSGKKSSPFVCPSCRAVVRDTRPNATVTTLVDMYVQANPTKAKTQEEREGLGASYTPGENVLAMLQANEETAEDAEDRRLLEQTRDMSLREVGIEPSQTSRPYQRGVRHRARSGQRQLSEEGHHMTDHGRRVEHQSSLISLLSSSDTESSAVEEEILRQIMDEGLLDGIDLRNLDVSQEDELSEKIADAYRKRYHRRSHSQSRDGQQQQRRSSPQQHRTSGGSRSQQRRHDRSPRTIDSTRVSTNPPLSRPHLLEAYPTSQAHQRRASSEIRRNTSPTPNARPRGGPDGQRPAARSSTDLSDRRNSEQRRRNRSRNGSNQSRIMRNLETQQAPAVDGPDVALTRHVDLRSGDSNDLQENHRDLSTAIGAHESRRPESNDTATMTRETHGVTHDGPERRLTDQEPTQLKPVPLITCQRCGKHDIELHLHYHCSICLDGDYNICQQCYRENKGCLQWYGFGKLAFARYEHKVQTSSTPSSTGPPHRMIGHRWTYTAQAIPLLQSGSFCDTCSAFAPNRYWLCRTCNDGDWGFCDPCVSQHRCCTHDLLPVKYVSHKVNTVPQAENNTAMNTQERSVIHDGSQSMEASRTSYFSQSYELVDIFTSCDECRYPIPPSTTRFHCPICKEGQYNICIPCYNKFLRKCGAEIRPEDGPKGWTRCPPLGHRMIVIGFQDSGDGLRRVVVENLKGGFAARGEDSRGWNTSTSAPSESDASADNITTGSYRNPHLSWKDGDVRLEMIISSPPRMATARSDIVDAASRLQMLKVDGPGSRMVALWSRWPETTDELSFPKGAELRECEEVNSDWSWGVYCGKGGLWPAGYGRKIDM